MGEKRSRHTWPEAKKLRRLNQKGIEMAKLPEPKPEEMVDDEERARLYEEQLYWEDYHDRNETRPAVEITGNGVHSSGRRFWANR